MDCTHPPIGSLRTVRIPFACPLPFRRTALYRYFFCGMEFEHRCRRRTTCPNELSPARRQPGRSDGGYLCRPLACLDSNASILPAVCRFYRRISVERFSADSARTCRQPPVAYAGRPPAAQYFHLYFRQRLSRFRRRHIADGHYRGCRFRRHPCVRAGCFMDCCPACIHLDCMGGSFSQRHSHRHFRGIETPLDQYLRRQPVFKIRPQHLAIIFQTA